MTDSLLKILTEERYNNIRLSLHLEANGGEYDKQDHLTPEQWAYLDEQYSLFNETDKIRYLYDLILALENENASEEQKKIFRYYLVNLEDKLRVLSYLETNL